MNYQIKDLIGKGSYGCVYRAVDNTTQKLYAVKKINIREATHYEKLCMVNELRILATHKCPFIVAFKDAYIYNDSIHIVTELALRGDLGSLLKQTKDQNVKMSENNIWHYFLQTCVAVDYLHKINIIHRDIKPDNVFIDHQGNIRLGDFGIIKIMRPYLLYGQTQIGTPLYMSPEIYKRERYDVKTDAWSIGCLLYEMMALKPPFLGHNMIMLRGNVCRGNAILESCKEYSMELYKIVQLLLRTQPRQRIGVSDVLKIPHVKMEMKRRGIFPQPKHLRHAFYTPCIIPRRVGEWENVLNLFCKLNNTIQLENDVKNNMDAIAKIKCDLEKYQSNSLVDLQEEFIQVTKSLQTAEKVVESHRRHLEELQEKIHLFQKNNVNQI